MATNVTSPRKKTSPSTEYGYTVVFERIPEGGYRATISAIPQVEGFGRTIEQAKERVQEELRRFIKTALEMGERIPSDLKPATGRVAVTVSIQ